jgi:tetratricopeptide (TPR) repeat protein
MNTVIETFRSLSLSRPEDPLVFAYWGMAYEKTDRMDLAHETWDKALRLEPNLSWLWERREQIYRAKDDLPSARRMATALTQTENSKVDGFVKLSELAELENKNEEAVTHLRSALKERDTVRLRLRLAEKLTAKPQEAIRVLTPALEKASDRKLRSEVLAQLGRHHCAQKDFATGNSYLRKAAKEKPDSASVFFERGICERRAGNAKKSADAFENALKYDSKNARTWYHYGITLQSSGKARAAISALQRSLALEASDQTHLALAQIYQSQRQSAEALVHARKALRMNPRNDRAKTLISQLEK